MAGIVIDNEYFRKIITTVILIVLLVLSFLILKPILLSVIMGVILAVIASPIYNWIFKKTKSKSISITLICVMLLLIMVVPFWVLTPIFIKQSFQVYVAAQQIDFTEFIEGVFPSLFSSE